MMIHQPLGGFSGQASDIDIHAQEILTVREKLNTILKTHTGYCILVSYKQGIPCDSGTILVTVIGKIKT
jgi:hypothetical protein